MPSQHNKLDYPNVRISWKSIFKRHACSPLPHNLFDPRLLTRDYDSTIKSLIFHAMHIILVGWVDKCKLFHLRFLSPFWGKVLMWDRGSASRMRDCFFHFSLCYKLVSIHKWGFFSRSRRAKKITAGICLISESRKLAYLRGLFFEHNAEIGQVSELARLRKDHFMGGH